MILEDPTNVPPDAIDHAAPLRWTCITLLVTTMLLGLTNPTVVGAWYDGLTPSPTTASLKPAIDAWSAHTDPLAAPSAQLRAGWERVRALRFGNEAAGEPGADAN